MVVILSEFFLWPFFHQHCFLFIWCFGLCLSIFFLNTFIVIFSVALFRLSFILSSVIFLSTSHRSNNFCIDDLQNKFPNILMEFQTWFFICLLDGWEIEGSPVSHTLHFINLKHYLPSYSNRLFFFLVPHHLIYRCTRNLGVTFISSLPFILVPIQFCRFDSCNLF